MSRGPREAAILLAGALEQDEGVRMIAGRSPRADWFDAVIDVALAQGGAVCSIERGGALAGVLLLGGSGGWGLPAMPRLLGLAGAAGFFRIARHDTVRRRTMAPESVVVEFIAVTRSMRGTGVARALMAQAAAAADGRPLWLDTCTTANIPLFGALGFTSVGTFSDGGVAFTAMQREAAE